MAKFDVYRNASENGYLLDAQADLLDSIPTRIVAPLVPLENAPTPIRRLNPVFEIRGEHCVMVTQSLAAAPVKILGQRVANLSDHFAEITNALDMVFQGF